ncbi:YncE family protein [Limobrevibacterium gyesilva]|uniref:PQQ-binding-like beta-propeller repeat protein n=1 Tax=Limobrevibacterium gyesilva TaxID=2991712 RepID=A0AA42CED9_9PROT|nr:PQQ-binding-like beta-propeller repeat protein [Limobrevibacterium gyesilva]MCW3475159.1 PQQ-binding-like beta-propeller repeat protein [Limobrevibacterium gyesilva]
MKPFLGLLTGAVLACGLVTSAWASGAVLVMNSAEASLSVIDMASRKELRRIPVLREPHHVMLTPDGRDLLVGDTVGNELIVLDPATFEVRRRVTMADPYQLGFSPDAKYLVVNGLARNQVDVYEAGTYKLVKRFPLRSMPSHLDFAPDSSAVYVSLQGTGKLAAIDLRRMAVQWTTDVGKAPAGVMWQNGRVLVAIMGSDDIAVVDPATGKVERRIQTGKGAHTLFRSPDKKTIYVNNRIAGTVVALDAATLKSTRSYKLPGGPDDIEFAPDGRVWVTMRFIHKVAVLDPATGQYETIDVGRSPHGIFLNAKATVK